MRNWNDTKKLLLTEDPLFTYCRRSDIDGIKKSVNIMNLDTRDEKGYSPLMLSAYYGHYEGVALLLNLGADIHSRDKNGNSILMAATFKGHLSIVELLLRHGADPEACNYKKQTALVFARTFKMKKIELILNRVTHH